MKKPWTVIRGEDNSIYMVRVFLTPRTKWGQLRFHWFARGDADEHLHDHPWEFWTFPLTSYLEQYMDDQEIIHARKVPAFRISHRDASLKHRVIGRFSPLPPYWYEKPILTIVWCGPIIPGSWGFYVPRDKALEVVKEEYVDTTKGNKFARVAWRAYLGTRKMLGMD